jgi:hypothetical protein
MMPGDRQGSRVRVTPRDRDMAEAWVSNLKAKGLKTASAYRDAVGGLLEFLDKPIADATLEDVLEYISRLSASRRSRNTVAVQIAAVQAFVEHCQGLGFFGKTPPDGERTTSVTAAWINSRVSSPEVERMLAAARDLFDSHPLGRPGRISVVLGVALPILLWIASDETTALGLIVLIMTIPFWMGAVRILLHIGQWMLTEPDARASSGR